MSGVIKNFNLDGAEGVAAAAALPPPPPPAKKAKQGIGSILGSEASAAASIRRTLSADMSSKKWLSQNGFSGFPAAGVKKVGSSGEFAADGHEEDELSRPGQDEVWRAIQAAQKQLPIPLKPALRSCESWSSILVSQKTDEDSSNLPPPYVHPLVKRRTASSLSEKSLEICTESLGSETGSDGFSSSNSPPESGDEEEEEKEDQEITSHHSFEAELTVKHSYSKRSPPRSFPPPLPSLAKNKASLQVLSRRQNGRLILEAVSVPPQDYLHAQRHDGRLLLTLVNAGSASEETGDRDEPTQVFDSFGETDDSVLTDDDDEEEDDDEQELTKEMGLNSNLPIMSAPPFMKEFKKNTFWVNNKTVDLMEEEKEDLIITPLPPPPPAGVAGLIPAAGFVNTYDYFWRKKPTVASVIIDTEQCKGGGGGGATNNLKNIINSNNNVVESPKVAGYEQKHRGVLLRGSMAANNILRGCKESRRSLLPWEPYCIATT
ncbi:PREDICTED: protein FAF-like, chloroplastic [Ipomoea nil]|uniref:protein FAF-like, chloroplastic n=1 Tax=Ipomoea nil TaxID=35883 RepID=UPI000901AEA5|nr:PREDICTED: protein FAF-like, chloroplastic [Ipomoea nil]